MLTKESDDMNSEVRQKADSNATPTTAPLRWSLGQQQTSTSDVCKMEDGSCPQRCHQVSSYDTSTSVFRRNYGIVACWILRT